MSTKITRRVTRETALVAIMEEMVAIMEEMVAHAHPDADQEEIDLHLSQALDNLFGDETTNYLIDEDGETSV